MINTNSLVFGIGHGAWLRLRLMLGLFLLGTLGAAAAAIPTQKDVVPGEWCSDYNAAKKYAENNGVPLIAVWGRAACSYSSSFDNNALSKDAFSQWRLKRKPVLLYGKDEDTADARSILSWVRAGKDSDTGQRVSLTQLPIVLVYWKQGGTVKVEKRFTGRSGSMLVTGGALLDQAIGSFDKYIGEYSPDPLPDMDAWDPVDNTRANATVLPLSQKPLAHGPHYLNGTDTNDWFRLEALPAGSTNLIWVTGLAADGATALSARFYAGDASSPAATVSLANLATPYKHIVPKNTGAPQDTFILVGRSPGTAASVRYTLNAREYIPRATGFATNAIVVTEPAKGKTVTLAIPVLRRGDDSAVATAVNVLCTDGTAVRGEHYTCTVTKLNWTATGSDTQTLNITLNGDGLWTGDKTFTVTLESPSAGFALSPFNEVMVTIREANAYSAGKLSFTAVESPALGKKTAFSSKLKPVVYEGDDVTVWLSCAGGNAATVSAETKWSSSGWITPKGLMWLDGVRNEQAIQFTVPVTEGFQRPQTVTLSVASAFGATLVSGKTALTLTVYDKTYLAPLTTFAASNPKLPLRAVNDDWFVTDGGVLRSVPLPEDGGSAVMTATLVGPGILRFAAGTEAAIAFTIGGKSIPVPIDGLVHEYLIPGGRQAVSWTVSGADTYGTLREMTYVPLPVETMGNFNGWVTVTNGAEIVQGLATMTVASSGKMSGKLILPGKALSFSAPAGYNTLTDGKLMVMNGLSATYKKEPPIPLTLSVSTNAPGVVLLTSADGTVTAHLNRNGWSDKVLTAERDAAMRLALNNPAGSLSKAPSGYYTLTIPATDESVAAGLAGTGYMTLTLDKKGKVKVAGKLADGTSVSLSGVLLLDDGNVPYVMLLVSPRAYSGGAFIVSLSVYFSGCARLSGNALWENRNPKATAIEGDGFSFTLSVAGGWYAKAETLRQMYVGHDGVSAETLGSPVYLGFNAKGTGLITPACDEANPACLKVSLKSTTGLFSGSFREPALDGKKDVTRKLFGVLTQGDADVAGAGFSLFPQTVPYKHTQSETFLLSLD